MHPAYSIVFFTTASGAGYGLLFLLGLGAAAGLLSPDFWLGLWGLGLALALVSAGLLSSAAHLGRPERAWRAFSQWRTSWLSREGVLAVVTYLPAGLFALGWVVLGRTDGFFALVALLAAAGAVATVAATAMIYASLKPVPAWSSRFTLPAYLVFALMTGATLLAALLHILGLGFPAAILLAIAATLAGWGLKLATWRHNDRLALPADAASATGLGNGAVRSLEWPHTEENFVLKEMGFRVARKHAARLRLAAQLLAFALPVLLLAGACLAGGFAAALLATLAAALQLAGMLLERWLFFAEAKHVVALYYGR